MVNWADAKPFQPPAIVRTDAPVIPNVPIMLTNLTRYQLRCEGQLLFTDGVPTVIRAIVSEQGVDPVKKELDELKQVFGDVLQEKLTGRNVYSVRYYDEPAHHTVYLTLERAIQQVQDEVGRPVVFERDQEYVSPRAWFADDSEHIGYRIVEHRIG